eukprot:GSChrysophyteH1.ASY1.ANO1.1434.1 assembled CDS
MRSSGWKQFRAHFGKNLLEKRRNTRTTICELTCHLVIVLIMLFGYGRTTTRDIPTTDYSVWNTTIPPSFVDSKTNQVDLLSAADYIDTLLTEPLPIPTFNTFLDAGNQLRATGIAGGTTSELLSLTGLGRRLDNLQYEGSICFAPRGPLVDSLLSYLNRTVPALNPNNNPYRIKVFDSEDEAVDYQQKYPRRRMFALIVLHQIRPDRVNYEIRMPYYLVPNTNRVISRNAIGLSSRYREYLYSGFLSTQDAIDKWVFEYTGAVPATNTTVDAAYEDPRCVKPEAWVMPFPVQEFNNNPFYNQVGYMLGLGLCMAYMYPLSRIVKASVEEKETKMREVMKIMGWSTFALTTGSFIKRSDKLLIFLFFWLFSMSLVTFAMLLSVFFSNSKLSSIVAPVMLYAMLLPRYIFFYTNDEELEVPKFLFSMLSPTAFAFGADAIANILSMLAFDVILYGVLALYLDRVLPQEVGTPLPWNFFLHWHYWFPKIIDDDENHADEEGQSASTNNTQKEKSLRINVKNIDGAKVFAVKHISLAMMEGEITCLLGANGAGKSTTIGVLTGLVDKTGGRVEIYGNNIDRHLQTIRGITGICPQQNVLVPSLTVSEHLHIFGRIKGVSDTTLHQEFVLLDEPTSGMDPYSRRSTWELLMRYKKGRVIVLTTHFMEEADTLGDRIAIMSEGALRCSGSSLFLKSRYGAGYVLSMVRNKDSVSLSDEGATLSPQDKATDDTLVTTGGAKLLQKLVRSVVPDSYATSAVAGEILFHLPLHSTANFGALFSLLKEQSSTLGVGGYGISITTLEQVFIRLAIESKMKSAKRAAKRERRLAGEEFDDSDDSDRFMIFSNRFATHDEKLTAELDENGFLPRLKPLASPEKRNPRSVSNTSPPPSALEGHPEKLVEVEQEEDAIEEKEASASVFIQFKELLKKRKITCLRDLKGAFFQIVFPSLQILLVLAILQLSWSPAGKTLKLQSNAIAGALKVAEMSKEDFPQPARYAGYAFNDSIAFNNQALIGGLLSTVGVDVNSSANSLLNTGNVSIPFTLPNVTYQFLNGSAPIAEDFLSTNIDFTPAQENVLANQITYNLVNNTVTFVDAELYIAPPVNDTFLVAPNETISPHSLAIFNAALVSSAFAQCSPVRADNHPLPVSVQRALEIKIVLSILASLFILVPLCYIPASFVPFLVKERISKSKHLQIVSGVSPITYWIATYVWDMALFTFLTMFCMFAFWIMVPLTYFYSMAFENPSTAQISITTFNFTTGFVGLLAVLIMSSLEETEELSFVLRDAVGYLGLVLFLETMLWKRIRFWFQRLKSQALVYDDDVAAEMELLENANPNDYALFYAVKNVSFACPVGERFGLLGINGAGKTTTLGVLTGDLSETAGDMFDPLLESLNGYETLWFFGRVRGIPEDVLFLDEPSTGMDPEARRSMWDAIETVSSSRSIVLVSHSMEECEALCTRIGIMVSGRMQCLGSTQHIKSRFGATYLIEIRCEEEEHIDEVVSVLSEKIGEITIEEQHGAFAYLHILDYSVSQATLEQIFIEFAKKGSDEREKDDEQDQPLSL